MLSTMDWFDELSVLHSFPIQPELLNLRPHESADVSANHLPSCLIVFPLAVRTQEFA